jgi:hypothetical protein
MCVAILLRLRCVRLNQILCSDGRMCYDLSDSIFENSNYWIHLDRKKVYLDAMFQFILMCKTPSLHSLFEFFSLFELMNYFAFIISNFGDIFCQHFLHVHLFVCVNQYDSFQLVLSFTTSKPALLFVPPPFPRYPILQPSLAHKPL